MQFLFLFQIILLGLCLGSFIALAVVRIPAGESVALPRSHCRACSRVLKWYENVPILSYLLLRGRCRGCQAKISLLYPIIEATTLGLVLVAYWEWQPLPRFFLYLLLFLVPMLILFWIDGTKLLLPDVLTLPGIVLGFAAHAVDRLYFKQSFPGFLPLKTVSIPAVLLESFWGALAGFGTLALIALIYLKIRKKDGIGGGDVKLAAMLGAFFGWPGMFVIFFLASTVGSILGVFWLLWQKKGVETALPFGSFLCGTAIVFALYGDVILGFLQGLRR